MQWLLDNMKILTATDWAAWWGALLATIVLLWDVIKWCKRGPKVKLDFDIRGNMKMYPPPPRNETYISIRASNTGDASVTLTNLAFVYYRNYLKFIFNMKAEKSFVIPQPLTTMPIPYKFSAGAIWDANIVQTKEIEDMCDSGVVCIVLFHSGSKKPLRGKLILKKSNY